MVVLLGKRKRRADLDEKSPQMDAETHDERLQTLLQKHFESQFKPLDIEPLAGRDNEAVEGLDETPEDSSDDWEGISDESDPDTVEVAQHESKDIADSWREKQERRSFMSNKPPSTSAAKSKTIANPRTDAAAEDAMEAANSKNDLALQRLLRESSLLKSSRTNAHGTMPSAVHPSEDGGAGSLALLGADRHKALDLRLQSLGAKESLFKQKKMPLTHRFGIVEKRRTQERERRRDARENGIVLERAVKGKKRDQKSSRRDRGVGGPSVGRMKGGTLVLSRSDVRAMDGKAGGVRGGKGRRR